ncbi:10959_t:CDS:2, partial [Scutellospora calospora]
MIIPNDHVNKNKEYKKNFYFEEHDAINIDLIYALTQANILLEKVDKLKLFFLKYCKNGSSIFKLTQLYSRYLTIAFNSEIENLKLFLVGKQISITIDKSPDICGKAAINILFSFYNITKLVKTEYLDIVNNPTITQL